MGTKGKEIAEVDVEKLIAELNKAFADEWLAYYQYWICAEIVEGPAARAIEGELKRIASEELEHAEELATRIMQLGGRPLKNFREVLDKTGCGYQDPPEDPRDVKYILKISIDGERCAIAAYSEILKMVHGKDPVTFQVIRHILEEEVEHEDTLERLMP